MSHNEMQGVSKSARCTSPYHPRYKKKNLAALPPTRKKPGNSESPESREEPMIMPIPEELASDEEIMRLKRDTKHLSFEMVLKVFYDRGCNVDDTIKYCEDLVVPNLICPISEQLIAACSSGLKRKKTSTVINEEPLYHRFFLGKHFKEEPNHLVEFYQNNKKKLPVLSRSRHSKNADPEEVKYLENLHDQYIIDIKKKKLEENRITREQKRAEKERAKKEKQKCGNLPRFPKRKSVIPTPRPRRRKSKIDSPEPLNTGNSIPKQPPILPEQRLSPTLPPEEPGIILPPLSPVQVQREERVTSPAELVSRSVTPEQNISTRDNSLVEHPLQITTNVDQFETTDISVENMPSTSASTKENESTRESSITIKRITRSKNPDGLFTAEPDVLKRKKRNYERFNGMFCKKGAPPPSPRAKKPEPKPKKKTKNTEDGKPKKRKPRKRLFGTHKHQYVKRQAFLERKRMKTIGIAPVSSELIPVANQPTTAPEAENESSSSQINTDQASTGIELKL